MTLETAVLDIARVSSLLAGALVSMPLLRRASASTRRWVLAFSLSGALVVPALSSFTPQWRVPAPTDLSSFSGVNTLEPVEETSTSATHTSVESPRSRYSSSSPLPSLSAVPWTTILLALWGIGAAVVLGRMVAGQWQVRRIIGRSRATTGWDHALDLAERDTGLRARVRVTDELDSPAVGGLFSPVVLVPVASEEWSIERQRSVLLHEITHVKHADCAMYVVAQMASALHWYNPLVWRVLRRLGLERELAADDAVLSSGTLPSSYARELMDMGGLDARRGAPTGALALAEPSALVARIHAIVANDRHRAALSRRGAAALTLGGSGLVLAVACATPTSSSATDSPPKPTTDAAGATTGIGTTSGTASGSKDAAGTVGMAAGSMETTSRSSTLDSRLQAIAEEELERTMAEWKGDAGVILVLDPSTGEVLANAGRSSAGGTEIATRKAYVTGSTFKVVTLAAALEEGAISATDRFDCEQGKRSYGSDSLRDWTSFGVLSVPEMLAVSTNIGFSKIFDRLGGEPLGRWIRRFHFGEAPAVAGSVAGSVPTKIEDHSFSGATVAIGETVTASPLQIAAAYATIANEGVYVAPTFTKRTGAAPHETVLKTTTAHTIVTMLEGAVNSDLGTGSRARVVGARVGGKTGTAEWHDSKGVQGALASFVGLAPVEKPRFVVYVAVENPRDEGPGGKVAAPAFSRVVTRALER